MAIDVPANIRQRGGAGGRAGRAEKVADGVWIVPGDAKSIAVEFRDHIVVVDAPETEARSIAVIDAVKKAIPGKPIRYVINTHSHFDHAGGLRTYAAEGATIVTHRANIPYLPAGVGQPADDQSRSAGAVGTHAGVRRRRRQPDADATARASWSSITTPATCTTPGC